MKKILLGVGVVVFCIMFNLASADETKPRSHFLATKVLESLKKIDVSTLPASEMAKFSDAIKDVQLLADNLKTPTKVFVVGGNFEKDHHTPIEELKKEAGERAVRACLIKGYRACEVVEASIEYTSSCDNCCNHWHYPCNCYHTIHKYNFHAVAHAYN